MGYHFLFGCGRILVRAPVYRYQQFEAKRRLEPFDELGHSCETFSAFGETIKEGASFLNGARDYFEMFVGRVSTVGIARYEMTFDIPEYMPQVLGVRSVMRLLKSQTQLLACHLHEVHQLTIAA